MVLVVLWSWSCCGLVTPGVTQCEEPRLLQDFAGSTTMHGAPKVLSARSRGARLLWLLLCLTMFTVLCLQCAQLLTKYYAYPKKVCSLIWRKSLSKWKYNWKEIVNSRCTVGLPHNNNNNNNNNNKQQQQTTTNQKTMLFTGAKQHTCSWFVLPKTLSAVFCCWNANRFLVWHQPANNKQKCCVSLQVTIEIVPGGASFPSISLCNQRNLDNVVLSTLQQVFNEDSKQWSNVSTDPFIQAYVALVGKYNPLYKWIPPRDVSKFFMVLTRSLLASNIDRNLLVKAGVPFEEFIVRCRFGQEECHNVKKFTHFFDPYYYNCFTYTAPSAEELVEGVENGWSTILLTGSGMLPENNEAKIYPGLRDTLSPVLSGDGVHVVIHPPDTEPYPLTEGYDVPSGFGATFGVKAKRTQRVGVPHGNCSHTDPYDLNKTGSEGHPYRLMSCQKRCLQKGVVQECHCVDINLPRYEGIPDLALCTAEGDFPQNCSDKASEDCQKAFWNLYAKIACAKDTKDKLARNASFQRDCGCFPPCLDITYDVTYSLTKWPPDTFEAIDAYMDIMEETGFGRRFVDDPARIALYADHFSASNFRQARRDFARLNVYMADSNVLKIAESEDYPHSQLLSDIGGQLGKFHTYFSASKRSGRLENIYQPKLPLKRRKHQATVRTCILMKHCLWFGMLLDCMTPNESYLFHDAWPKRFSHWWPDVISLTLASKFNKNFVVKFLTSPNAKTPIPWTEVLPTLISALLFLQVCGLDWAWSQWLRSRNSSSTSVALRWAEREPSLRQTLQRGSRLQGQQAKSKKQFSVVCPF